MIKLPYLRLLFCFTFVLALSACSTTPLQSRSLDTTQYSPVELERTPFFPQEAYQCGPAALATVLNFSGHEISTETLTDQVYLPDRQGSLQAELVAATRRAGRVPYVMQPQLVSLFEELEAGNPVLVLQNLRLPRWPEWHYAVVIGFEPENEQVILRSGTTEREIMSLRRFEQTWQLGDYWALVITEPGTVPVTAQEIPYLAAVAELERQQRFEAAIAGYQGAAQRWPENYTPVFGLANIAFQQGNYGLAEDYYYHAADLEPENPVIYFNLAWALERQGKHDSAMEAARTAAILAPEHERYGRAPELIENQR